MVDGRRTGRSDRIWPGAILTSCLVHFCIVAVGWMLSSNPDSLIELKNSIRISLIKPQSKPRPIVPAPTRKPPQQISKPQPVETSPAMETPRQIKPSAPVAKKQPPTSVAKPAQSAQSTTPKKTAVKTGQKVKIKPAQKPVTGNTPSPTPEEPLPMATAAVPSSVPPAVVQPEGPAEVSTKQPPSHATSIKQTSTAAITESSAQSSEKATASARDNYLQLLRERIDRYKRYPLMARKGRQKGVVLVEFELSAAGNLKNYQVHESCGHRLLDRAALQAVATAAPFPEAPPQIELIEANFIIPVHFVLSR